MSESNERARPSGSFIERWNNLALLVTQSDRKSLAIVLNDLNSILLGGALPQEHNLIESIDKLVLMLHNLPFKPKRPNKSKVSHLFKSTPIFEISIKRKGELIGALSLNKGLAMLNGLPEDCKSQLVGTNAKIIDFLMNLQVLNSPVETSKGSAADDPAKQPANRHSSSDQNESADAATSDQNESADAAAGDRDDTALLQIVANQSEESSADKPSTPHSISTDRPPEAADRPGEVATEDSGKATEDGGKAAEDSRKAIEDTGKAKRRFSSDDQLAESTPEKRPKIVEPIRTTSDKPAELQSNHRLLRSNTTKRYPARSNVPKHGGCCNTYRCAPTISCDNCSVAVHLCCFGISTVPNKWLCSVCHSVKADEVSNDGQIDLTVSSSTEGSDDDSTELERKAEEIESKFGSDAKI